MNNAGQVSRNENPKEQENTENATSTAAAIPLASPGDHQKATEKGKRNSKKGVADGTGPNSFGFLTDLGSGV